MKISVIITTKNEEKHIENCLESIKKQNFSGEIEIIVVDNNSQDKTKEIAGKYTSLVFNAGPERSAQRNFGVEKSSSDWLVFLDADMILGENIIAECVEKIEKSPQTVGLYIPEIILGNSLFSRVRGFERSFYDGTAIDCVRFVSKQAFFKAGGFDEELTGPEDWDFDKRIRRIGKTAIIKSAIFHNEADLKIKQYLRKKAYYAKSFEKYISKWGEDDSDIKKQLGLSYRFFGVFIENRKWIKILKHPFLALGMFFCRVAVGAVFLMNYFEKNCLNKNPRNE